MLLIFVILKVFDFTTVHISVILTNKRESYTLWKKKYLI